MWNIRGGVGTEVRGSENSLYIQFSAKGLSSYLRTLEPSYLRNRTVKSQFSLLCRCFPSDYGRSLPPSPELPPCESSPSGVSSSLLAGFVVA